MTGPRWAAIAGYLAVVFGGLLIGSGLSRSWANFPIAGGAFIAFAGVVIFWWIRPER